MIVPVCLLIRSLFESVPRIRNLPSKEELAALPRFDPTRGRRLHARFSITGHGVGSESPGPRRDLTDPSSLSAGSSWHPACWPTPRPRIPSLPKVHAADLASLATIDSKRRNGRYATRARTAETRKDLVSCAEAEIEDREVGRGSTSRERTTAGTCGYPRRRATSTAATPGPGRSTSWWRTGAFLRRR